MAENLIRNRYRVLQKLGHGGFGDTWLVEDMDLPSRRKCVLKQLKPKDGIEGIDTDHEYRQIVERFENEAATLERLGEDSNGRIPKLFAYFVEGGQFFLVQEYVEGQTLRQKLKAEGRLSEAFVRDLLAGLLETIDYVHGQNIIHRDIKPDNVIIRQRDGKPVLIDFGIVKEVLNVDSLGNPTSSIPIGTPGYTPPEQNVGRPVFSSDLYSLGMTAIALLTGKGPKTLGQNPLTGEIKWREQAPGAGDELVAILDKAVTLNHLGRYKTAREMLAALRTTRGASELSPTVAAVPDARPRASFGNENRETPAQVRGTGPPPPVFTAMSPTVAAPLPPAPKPRPSPSPAVSSEPAGKNSAGVMVGIGGVVVLIVVVLASSSVFSSKKGSVPLPPVTVSRPSGKTLTNKIGMEFVEIPAGSFDMRSTNGSDDEKPVHRVTIGKAFYLGKYEVTQAQWKVMMGGNPSYFKGDDLPVEQVSWDNIQEFLKRLNARNDGNTYRLPSEAEWEYACRAGTTGDWAGDLDAMGWYGNNSGNKRIDAVGAWIESGQTWEKYWNKYLKPNGNQTHPVGQKKPNDFGLYDMHGNVWEWCEDVWHDNYNGAPTDGSAWVLGGDQNRRVLRGGSWGDDLDHCRLPARVRVTPGSRNDSFGFRVMVAPRTQ